MFFLQQSLSLIPNLFRILGDMIHGKYRRTFNHETEYVSKFLVNVKQDIGA